MKTRRQKTTIMKIREVVTSDSVELSGIKFNALIQGKNTISISKLLKNGLI
jgi:hypothetical protein